MGRVCTCVGLSGRGEWKKSEISSVCLVIIITGKPFSRLTISVPVEKYSRNGKSLDPGILSWYDFLGRKENLTEKSVCDVWNLFFPVLAHVIRSIRLIFHGHLLIHQSDHVEHIQIFVVTTQNFTQRLNEPTSSDVISPAIMPWDTAEHDEEVRLIGNSKIFLFGVVRGHSTTFDL